MTKLGEDLIESLNGATLIAELRVALAKVTAERERLDKLVWRFVNKSNAVIAPHRHAHTMSPALDALYAVQLEAEALAAGKGAPLSIEMQDVPPEYDRVFVENIDDLLTADRAAQSADGKGAT